jgi:glycosyltransferase involved in cell wall biosynthesis
MDNIDIKLKSLAIVTFGMGKGGAERVISLLANHFSKLGARVRIYTLLKNKCEYELSPSVELIPLAESMGRKYGHWDTAKRMIKLRREIKNFSPEVTLIMPEEISAIAVPTLLGLKTAVIVSERNNPWIMPRNRMKRLLRFLFYRTADGFIFQTNQAKSFFSNKIGQRSRVIANPLSMEIINHLERGALKKEIVSVGRLSAQKNFSLLIEAFKIFKSMHPDYSLRIFGEGELRDSLQNKISNLDLSGSVFLPGKSDCIFEDIKDAEMFVLSSDFEGMPNALMEAMALRLSVVSTDCPSGGPAELIEDGVNGLLVPRGNAEAMAKAMAKIASSPELSRRLSSNAGQIMDRLNPERILKEWSDYLNLFVKG